MPHPENQIVKIRYLENYHWCPRKYKNPKATLEFQVSTLNTCRHLDPGLEKNSGILVGC